MVNLLLTKRICSWAQRVAVGIGILLVAPTAPAADFIWTNTAASGYFTNPAVWSVNGTPGLNDNVWLINNSVYTIWGSNNAALFSANVYFTNTVAGSMTVTYAIGNTTWTVTNQYNRTNGNS